VRSSDGSNPDDYLMTAVAGMTNYSLLLRVGFPVFRNKSFAKMRNNAKLFMLGNVPATRERPEPETRKVTRERRQEYTYYKGVERQDKVQETRTKRK
jgi:hypothetical protein